MGHSSVSSETQDTNRKADGEDCVHEASDKSNDSRHLLITTTTKASVLSCPETLQKTELKGGELVRQMKSQGNTSFRM